MTDTTARGLKVCVECGKPAQALYKVFSENNIRLSLCQACGCVADKYVEYEMALIVIDLVLLKRQAYRHLMYNSGMHASSARIMQLIACSVLLDASFKWVMLQSTSFDAGVTGTGISPQQDVLDKPGALDAAEAAAFSAAADSPAMRNAYEQRVLDHSARPCTRDVRMPVPLSLPLPSLSVATSLLLSVVLDSLVFFAGLLCAIRFNPFTTGWPRVLDRVSCTRLLVGVLSCVFAKLTVFALICVFDFQFSFIQVSSLMLIASHVVAVSGFLHCSTGRAGTIVLVAWLARLLFRGAWYGWDDGPASTDMYLRMPAARARVMLLQ